MIRFPCPSCKNILNAPDDRAGQRLACPGCKQPVQVPTAMVTAKPPAPSPLTLEAPAPAPAASEPAAPPRPFFRRFMAECGAIAVATFLQTIRPISYVFSVQYRNKLRRRAADAQFALGQRMYEVKIGDKNLAGRIQELGERIHNIQAVRGDAREAQAERKKLITQMAEPALARDKVPDSIQGEHERARAAKAKLQEQEHSLAGALGGLLPPDALGWRRIIIGYGLAFTLLIIGGVLYYQSVQQANIVKAREAEKKTKEDELKQKQADEEREWQREKKTEEIVTLCGPSVALIRFKEGEVAGGGTGFMIRPGLLVTNAHVINEVLPHQLKIYYPSAKDLGKTPHSAKVVHFDAKRDLAILAVEPKVPPLRLASQFEFRSGMNITIIGCPSVGEKQLENAPRSGNLSTKTEVGKMPFYELGISVNPGNSGGPVFDSRGQVIGVVALKARQEGTGFCIPWQDLKDHIEALEKEDPAKSAAIGQSNHHLAVILERGFGVSGYYLACMRIIALHLQSSPQNGFTNARREIQAKLGDVEQRIMTPEMRAIAAKLPSDPNLPPDVRKKYAEAWNLLEEMRSYCEKPRGNSLVYTTKGREFATKLFTEVIPFVKSLGFDPTIDADPDK
jgi:S1-C subfamily serine protease